MMNKIMEKYEKIFAAVSFAEQGEWKEALRMVDDSAELRTVDRARAQSALEKTFAAVSFAEMAEWEDAVMMADGSLGVQAADGKQIHARKTKRDVRRVDNRPKLYL